MRGYKAQQGRELSRCLKELRALRREPLENCTDEPDSTSRNEPGRPPEPANDDAAMLHAPAESLGREISRNKPEPAATDELPQSARAELDRLPPADDWIGPARLPAHGAPRDALHHRRAGAVAARPR